MFLSSPTMRTPSNSIILPEFWLQSLQQDFKRRSTYLFNLHRAVFTIFSDELCSDEGDAALKEFDLSKLAKVIGAQPEKADECETNRDFTSGLGSDSDSQESFVTAKECESVDLDETQCLEHTSIADACRLADVHETTSSKSKKKRNRKKIKTSQGTQKNEQVPERKNSVNGGRYSQASILTDTTQNSVELQPKAQANKPPANTQNCSSSRKKGSKKK